MSPRICFSCVVVSFCAHLLSGVRAQQRLGAVVSPVLLPLPHRVFMHRFCVSYSALRHGHLYETFGRELGVGESYVVFEFGAVQIGG